MGKREVTKHELDLRTAEACGVARAVVGRITREFLFQMRMAAVEDGVNIQGLGVMRVIEYRVRFKSTGKREQRFAMRFRPSRALQEQVRSYRRSLMSMDKYGVEEKQKSFKDMTKLAAEGCPNCGSKNVTRDGNVLRCPRCGTEPFENAELSNPETCSGASRGRRFLFPEETWPSDLAPAPLNETYTA